MTRCTRLIAGPLLGLASLGSHADDSSFVWEVQGPHARHCLVGAALGLPASVKRLPDNVESCYARAEVVAVEAVGKVVTDGTTVQPTAVEITERTPGGLVRRIGARLYRLVAQQAELYGLDAGQFNVLRPWFAAETLASFRLIGSLARPDNGIGRRLYWRAQEDRKATATLESDAERAAVFTQMSDEASIQHLEATLAALLTSRDSATDTAGLWLADDVRGLDAFVAGLEADYPAFYRRWVVERNQAWLARLRDMLRSDRPHLIVVGLEHVAGDDGLRQLLLKERFATLPLRTPAATPDALDEAMALRAGLGGYTERQGGSR